MLTGLDRLLKKRDQYAIYRRPSIADVLLWRAGTGSGVVWRRSPAPQMARVDDVVCVGVDDVAALTGALASAAFTNHHRIPRRRSDQTPVT